jgi:hypothetical protein
MSAVAPSFFGAPDDRPYALVERRFRELREDAFLSTPDAALASFMQLRTLVDADVREIKGRLFSPSLSSRDDDKAASRWISAQHRRLGRIALRMAETHASLTGPSEQSFRLLAPALHYMGESVKGHIKESHFHRALHALMRNALASNRHHEQIYMEVDGRLVACTLMSLYFRALLLARVAGGGLTFAQTEILDAWLWIWMPALAGADTVPLGAAWRADLDSDDGLRRGVRKDEGPSVYLPMAPLETMRLAIIKEFHAGRTVSARGAAAKFGIEDHFAALDTVRRTLRGIRHESSGRGTRYPAKDVVELQVGLEEVMVKGFTAAGPAIALDPIAADRAHFRSDARDHATIEIDDARRVVQLIDVSDTGLSFEGDESDCSEIAVGDLVATRIATGEALLLASVVRRLPAATGGRVAIGLRRLTSAAQPVRARQPSWSTEQPDLLLLYIPGADESGQHDAYLTSAAVAAERGLFETTVGDDTFTFRFNRVLESGRGWVMAGFEITAARTRKAAPAANKPAAYVTASVPFDAATGRPIWTLEERPANERSASR